jgi:hypothetical protein
MRGCFVERLAVEEHSTGQHGCTNHQENVADD